MEEIVIELEDDNIDIDIQNEATRTITEKDYNNLENKPQINNITLIDNRSLDELGIQPEGEYADTRITNTELEAIFGDW